MSRTTFLPFAKPSLTETEFQEVRECLESGWITTGPRVQKFERALQDYFGTETVFTTHCATAGLHLALKAMDLQPGDEVITTTMTWISTLNAIVHAGGRPVLVDMDPKTYTMDLDQVARAITPKTRAILPVHYAGAPVDLDRVYALAEQHNLHILEDCAHAIGTEYKGKKLGTFGHTQVFSFHPNKNMTTGEGGCVVCHDPNLFERMKRLRFHGINKDAFNRYAKEGSPFFDVVEPGFKYNMMDIQASLGLHQLPKLESFIKRRKALVDHYQETFRDWETLTCPVAPNYDHGHAWHLYIPCLNLDKSPVSRDALMQQMKEHNIGLGFHYQAAHLFTYYRETYGYGEGDFPHAEDYAHRAFSLPLFPAMTDQDQDDVIQALRTILKG